MPDEIPYTQPGLLLGAPIGAGALGYTGDIQWLAFAEEQDTALFAGFNELPLPPPPKPRPPAVRIPIQRVIEDRGVDIRLVQDPRFPAEGVVIDWQLRRDGTIDDTEALATAIVVALGTDARADSDEELPDPDSTDQRGWWGDYQAQEIWGGWPIGSKLWLMRREALLPPRARRGSTTVRVEHYVREAIQPFIERRVGTQLYIDVERHGKDRIDILVRLYRGPAAEIDLRYSVLWSEIMSHGNEYGLGSERAKDYW